MTKNSPASSNVDPLDSLQARSAAFLPLAGVALGTFMAWPHIMAGAAAVATTLGIGLLPLAVFGGLVAAGLLVGAAVAAFSKLDGAQRELFPEGSPYEDSRTFAAGLIVGPLFSGFAGMVAGYAVQASGAGKHIGIAQTMSPESVGLDGGQMGIAIFLGLVCARAAYDITAFAGEACRRGVASLMRGQAPQANAP